MRVKIADGLEDWEHGWADRTGRFPLDQLARRYGWTISDRPNGSPALWKKPGKLLTLDEVLEQIAADVLNLAT